MKKTFAILILLLLLPFSIHAFSIKGEQKVHSFRCKGKIIKRGLRKAQVLKACGKPTTVVDLGYLVKKGYESKPGEKYGMKSRTKIILRDHMERWIYRRSGRFPIIITFKNGSVQTLAHGDKGEAVAQTYGDKAEAVVQKNPSYPPGWPFPMYCNKVVIKPGASTQQVLLYCGVPDSRDKVSPGHEEWTYINNHTPAWDFHLTFENGRLESIQRY